MLLDHIVVLILAYVSTVTITASKDLVNHVPVFLLIDINGD